MLKEKIKIDDDKTLYFVGDIHGHFDVLNYALKSLGFSKKDALVSVGDLIDRGDQNIEVLSFFINTENTYGVFGNHEDFAIKAMLYDIAKEKNIWLSNGGWWHKDYPELFIKGLLKGIYKKFRYALEIEYGGYKFGVCHAEYPFDDWDRELKKKDTSALVWNRVEVQKQYSNRVVKNVDFLIHGHTIFKEPYIIGNQHWIDTGVYRDCGQGDDHCLTIAEFKKGKFVYHRFERDLMEISGFVHK